MDYKVSNTDETPVEEIVEQLKERRPLPLGRKEFEEFCERIWAGAMIKGEPGNERLLELSVKSLLADEIVHLPGHQTHETDIHFINRARKLCANQVAITIKAEIHKEIQEELRKVRGEDKPKEPVQEVKSQVTPIKKGLSRIFT